MEDQNINASSAANAAAQPAAVDKNLKHFSWLLKVTAALFLCSVIAALSLSAKIDSQKKSPADSEKSSISELKEKVSKKTDLGGLTSARSTCKIDKAQRNMPMWLNGRAAHS